MRSPTARSSTWPAVGPPRADAAAGFRRAIPLIGVGIVAAAIVVIGFFLFVVPGVIAACAVGVATPAVVVEKIGPIAAIRRSFDLTRGHRLTFFAASFVVGMAVSVASMPTRLAVMLLGEPDMAAVVFGVVIHLLVAALPLLMPAVAYHELRAAKEGIVTEELVKVFEQSSVGKYLLYSAVMTPGMGYVGLVVTGLLKECWSASLMAPTVAAAMCVAQVLSVRIAIRESRGETKTSKPRPGAAGS